MATGHRKGNGTLHFDDILADALELGPLQNKDFDLPEETIQRITELTPKGVPVEASIPLEELKYYDEATNSWLLEHTAYEFLVGPSAAENDLHSVNLAL